MNSICQNSWPTPRTPLKSTSSFTSLWCVIKDWIFHITDPFYEEQFKSDRYRLSLLTVPCLSHWPQVHNHVSHLVLRAICIIFDQTKLYHILLKVFIIWQSGSFNVHVINCTIAWWHWSLCVHISKPVYIYFQKTTKISHAFSLLDLIVILITLIALRKWVPVIHVLSFEIDCFNLLLSVLVTLRNPHHTGWHVEGLVKLY